MTPEWLKLDINNQQNKQQYISKTCNIYEGRLKSKLPYLIKSLFLMGRVWDSQISCVWVWWQRCTVYLTK